MTEHQSRAWGFHAMRVKGRRDGAMRVKGRRDDDDGAQFLPWDSLSAKSTTWRRKTGTRGRRIRLRRRRQHNLPLAGRGRREDKARDDGREDVIRVRGVGPQSDGGAELHRRRGEQGVRRLTTK